MSAGRWAWMAAVAVGLAGCAAEPGPEAGGGSLQEGRPARPAAAPGDSAAGPAASPPPGADRLLDSIRAGEEARLAAVGPAVRRPRWDVLAVTARSGAVRRFEDRAAAGQLAYAHVYRGYVAPIAQHLVERIYFPEGGEFVLVDAVDGDSLGADGPPLPSPDGRRFATASTDLVAGHRPNRIRIYGMRRGRPALEWEHAPAGWGLDSLRWGDARTIHATRVALDTTAVPFRTLRRPARVELGPEGWRVAGPD